MKKINIFKRKANKALLFAAVILGVTAGCKKGTFEINDTNPNSPSSVPPKYTLSSSLAATANLMFGGNEDFIDNWMGYWTQSGAYTPSNSYVLYQINSSFFTGNWDNAYINLENYKLMITTAGTLPAQANYRAVGMIMTAFVYQRIVDLYNNAPYTGALTPNNTFSYKYDNGGAIYKALIAKVDSAVAIINANSANATALGAYDVMFNNKGGTISEAVEMGNWIKFANTLKLKMLMRQTQGSANGSLGDAGVKAALANNPATGKQYAQADFLGVGQDAVINPGYSNAADNQLNPLYFDIVANAQGAPTGNEIYYRANSYGVNFYKNNNDPRLTLFYRPNAAGAIQGRAYGSQNGNEANSVISALAGTGVDGTGAYKGPGQDSPIITAFESLFLQAEAIQRGYITGSAATTYQNAVAESFRFMGVADPVNAAATYTAQANRYTNFLTSSNPIQTIITQKWAACNSIDPLESYSDYRRLTIPTDLPVSIYPGNTAAHIPYRLPYPNSELNYNGANVPDGGTGTESLTSKIFWMP